MTNSGTPKQQGGLLSRSLRVLKHSVSSFGSSSSSHCPDVHKQQTPRTIHENEQPAFASLEALCRELQLVQGLESSNLLVAVDFTKSNAWTGELSFGGRSLHSITPGLLNPYEETLEALCNALESFDDDNLYPCYGFGDASTKDQRVFSFYDNALPCEGAQGVLARYRDLAPHVRLAGPTSFAPIIREAMRVVIASGCQYHMLLIIADGLVTSSDPEDTPTPTIQETSTAQALTDASALPLSIVVVGVGDGPWHVGTWQDGKDQDGARRFDNYHFVDATALLQEAAREGLGAQERASRLAMHALSKVPEQYRAIRRLGLMGCTVSPSLANKVGPGPLPPPLAAASSGGSASTGGPSTVGGTGPHAAVVAPLCCPLTGAPMVDPVVAADGYIYERTAIAHHLTTVGPRSPITKAPLAHTQLLPCNSLRSAASGVTMSRGMIHPGPPQPPLTSHTTVGSFGGPVQHHYMRTSSDPGDHPHGGGGDWGRMRPSSMTAWDGGMLTAMHMYDPMLAAQSNTDASMPSMHSISSASSRERPGGTPQGPSEKRGPVGLPDPLATLADDLDRLSVEIGERRRSLGAAPAPVTNPPPAWPTSSNERPAVALPGSTPPSTRSPNPFAAAARRTTTQHTAATTYHHTTSLPPPRPSHEGVVFGDDDDGREALQSAFMDGEDESEGGSLPGLEGPRPRGVVGRMITRVGTCPPVPLADWDAVKRINTPSGLGREGPAQQGAQGSGSGQHGSGGGQTSSTDAGIQLPVVDETSPFMTEDAPTPAVPLFPATEGEAEELLGEPSWVRAAPSATAQQLSPFVAATAQQQQQQEKEALKQNIER